MKYIGGLLMKKLFGLVISLIMVIPLFAKEIPMKVTEFESGFEISNLDAKGKKLCKGFLSLEQKDDLFVILKTEEDSFSMKKLAYEILYRPSSSNAYIMDGSSFIRIDKDKKTQLYGPLSDVDSIIIISSKGKIIDCSSIYDGKNMQIFVGEISDEKNKLSEAIEEFKLVDAEQEKIAAERKAEEERKKAELERKVAEQELERQLDPKIKKQEEDIKKELDYCLSQKEVYKNDTFAYMLTQDGTIAIVAYLGDSKDVLEIPKEIEGITVDRIIYMKSISKVSFNKIIIPKNIKLISARAFYNLGIEEIIFEENSLIQEIRQDAFRYNSLTKMNVPRKRMNIGFDAFSDNRIKKVSIYKDWCFWYESNRYDNKFIGASESLRSDVNSIIYSDVLEEVVFEEGVTDICPRAFAGCKKLKKITIPSSMRNFGACAFLDCSSLSEIDINGKPITSIKDSVGDYKKIDIDDYFRAAISGSFKEIFNQYDIDRNPFSALYIFRNCKLDLKTKKILIDMGFPTDAF